MALGNLNYYEHFFPHYMAPEKEGGFGKTLYKRSPPRASDSDSEDVDADELGLVFFGEVCSSTYGTAITAKGNHYGGTHENPKVRTIKILHSLLKLTIIQPITDSSVVKDIIVLRPLTMAPPESLVDVAFINQSAGLEEILDEDAKSRSIHPNSESVCHLFPALYLTHKLTEV